MTLVKFSPFESFQDTVQKYFDDVITTKSSYTDAFVPSIDVSEKGNQLFIEAEIPGIKKEDLKLTIQDNILTIEGEKKNNFDDEKRYLINERRYGSFKRSFTLPEDINSEKGNAEFKDGVLFITLEKVEEKAPVEKIIKVK